MWKRLVSANIVLALSIAVPAQEPTVDNFFDTFAAEWVRNDPNLATANRYFTGDEQQRLERELTPVGEAYRRARIERARRGLSALQRFDRSRLSDAQRLSADVFHWRLTAIVDGERFLDYTYPFEQFRGVNITIVDALTVQQPLATLTDARNFIARIGRVPVRMREAIAEAQRLERNGIIPPRFILRATIAQMQQFVGSPAEQNPLITTMAPRLDALTGVPAAQRASLRAEAVQAVNTQVYPAWRAAIAVLEGMLPRATDDAGLWRLSDGPAAYAYQLRVNTTTSFGADEIHRIGLEQVARIESETGALLARLGRTEGSLQVRINQLKKEQGYPLTEEGRTRIMADIDAILGDALARSRELFELTPKAPVVAESFPRFREATAAGQYTPPSPDGSRPGTFRIPLRPDRMTKFGLRTLTYHETVPGHHYQIALGREDQTLPRFRRLGILGVLPAITEGWGLYAERLAVDFGWYDDDPIGQLGQLDAELFRARRLVVDTGLHAKRWTRQQAIDYGIEASEVDRYVVLPGQACAYMLGQLKLIELREKTKQALGARFSLREFHTMVQRTGAVPLELLEREWDRFIEARR
jgi:uncharacterized protein (DUF885 family)